MQICLVSVKPDSKVFPSVSSLLWWIYWDWLFITLNIIKNRWSFIMTQWLNKPYLAHTMSQFGTILDIGENTILNTAHPPYLRLQSHLVTWENSKVCKVSIDDCQAGIYHLSLDIKPTHLHLIPNPENPDYRVSTYQWGNPRNRGSS